MLAELVEVQTSPSQTTAGVQVPVGRQADWQEPEVGFTLGVATAWSFRFILKPEDSTRLL